jgi:hypothetical protein
MRGCWLAGATVAVLMAAGSPAFAICPGTDVLLLENFDRLQPAWGEPNSVFRVVEGQLVVSPKPEQVFWRNNSASIYDDIDMCVTMTTIAEVEPDGAEAGLVFWYVDENNFYAFELAPNGKASVWRRQRGRWLEQVDWQDAEGANTGNGAINELRVTTVGNQATFYVNGNQFKELSGSPPDEGQQIGLYASSPESGAASFGFDNLKVTRP